MNRNVFECIKNFIIQNKTSNKKKINIFVLITVEGNKISINKLLQILGERVSEGCWHQNYKALSLKSDGQNSICIRTNDKIGKKFKVLLRNMSTAQTYLPWPK